MLLLSYNTSVSICANNFLNKVLRMNYFPSLHTSLPIVFQLHERLTFYAIINSFLKLFSNSLEGTPEFLLQYIDKETLPKFLGGTRTDTKGDPYCKEFVSIDSDYYFLGSNFYLFIYFAFIAFYKCVHCCPLFQFLMEELVSLRILNTSILIQKIFFCLVGTFERTYCSRNPVFQTDHHFHENYDV